MTLIDPHRPIYHFMPPSGWMNDPNGPITAADGTHHLFYQHNPDGGWHEQMHWGHAQTRDLVRWEHQPIALYPDMPYDKDGIYSGSAIELDGNPVLFYTGIRPEVQCIALGDAGYANWSKLDVPIVPTRPEGLDLDGFRDPTLWHDPDTGKLNMGIGSGVLGGNGCVLRYESSDGVRGPWSYKGFLLGEHPDLLVNCECPDYWRDRDDVWAMIASPQGANPRRGAGTVWLTGEHSEEQFLPIRQGLLDACPLYYAPKSFWHIDGRRVVWGWMREARSVAKEVGRAWAGVMSLPRDLTVGDNGLMTVRPSPEVELLRGDRVFRGADAGELYGVRSAELNFAGSPAIEHCIELEQTHTGTATMCLFDDPATDERIDVAFDFETHELSLSLQFAWEDGDGTSQSRTTVCGVNPDLPNADGQFRLGSGEPLRLRVFMDHSVIEIFANDRAALSGRYYPTAANAPGLCEAAYSASAYAEGRDLRITRWDVCPIPSIW